MIPILVKDLRGFFTSLTGYLVVGVFVTAMGLLVWVFPETSVLEYGYADLGTFFTVGPYLLIFLAPAVTMKSLAEEKRLGTFDLLLSKPIREWHLVLAKFMASLLVVWIALLPGWLYYATVHHLGSPPGNLDTPGFAGSFIGLMLLSSVYCAMGLWVSGITSNQIVAFVGAAFLCFLSFQGFQSVATLFDTSVSEFIRSLGLMYHYESMGRGLLDTRDVLYFFSVIGAFLVLTKTTLNSRLW
jgi:ABC-2 type transport system permease protein